MSLGHRLSEQAGLGQGDVYMRELMQQLPSYLVTSRSTNTNVKYQGYFRRFSSFMSSQNKQSLPANSIHLALFIVHLMNSGVSHHVIYSYICAIKWVHNLHGFSDPTASVHVKNLLDSSKRRPKKPSQKKDVFSPDVIKSLFDKYEDSNDLLVLRDLAIIIVSFTGFLRYDEMSNIKCCDVTFMNDHVKIIITKSKTDQYRDGNEILLSRINSSACPVKALKKYLSLSGLSLSSQDYLFRGVYKISNGKSGIKTKNRRFSYTRCREVILKRLKEVAPDNLNLGLHSLRASGATAAVNSGVNDRCWRRHGRWRSDASHRYIKDSLESRMQVSQNLGL